MIPCCWPDALLWTSRISVSEPRRLGVVRERQSPLPILGPSCGRVVSVSEQPQRWLLAQGHALPRAVRIQRLAVAGT